MRKWVKGTVICTSVTTFSTLSHRGFESSRKKWQLYTDGHKEIDGWLTDAEQTLAKAELELTLQIKNKIKVFHLDTFFYYATSRNGSRFSASSNIHFEF